MKLGIVGLPNVGKSTLFNSLTKAGAESANYPFCTIDPNVGVVTVPDERLNVLGEMYHTKKIVPAVIEFVDIAGLVKGASKGEGLGNHIAAESQRQMNSTYPAFVRSRLPKYPKPAVERIDNLTASVVGSLPTFVRWMLLSMSCGALKTAILSM